MENKLARIFRSTGLLRFFLPLGLLLIVAGIFILSTTPKEYHQTVGVVTGAVSYTDTDSENHTSTYFEIQFDYTVDGTKYQNSFNGYTDPLVVGTELPVYYDPDNPEHVSNTKNPGMIALIMIIAGAAAAAFGIFSGLKAYRKNKALDEQIKSASGTGEIPVIVPVPKQELTEYYVSYDGNTLKPGYLVEDRSRNVLFTAPMTKNAAIGNRVFTFTDRRLGRTAEHQVGHTVTQSFDNEVFSTSSYFKFDGENIWDVLHRRGIRIETDLRSQFPKTVYTVSLNGLFFATVETSSKYVHEEDEAEHKIKLPIGRFYYRCWTNEPDLELLFLTVFAISETEQIVVE